MKEKLTMEEYEEVKQLVESALDAPNKKEAQKYINKIQSFEYNLCGNVNFILGELVSYVRDASGRVPDKERRIYSVKTTLYKLGSNGVEK